MAFTIPDRWRSPSCNQKRFAISFLLFCFQNQEGRPDLSKWPVTHERWWMGSSIKLSLADERDSKALPAPDSFSCHCLYPELTSSDFCREIDPQVGTN
jgi:hypothetical protein